MNTPLIQTMTKDELPVSSPQTSPSGQGVGSGTGAPGICVPPARVTDTSESTSTRETASFFIDSPLVEVTELGGFAAITEHSTTPHDPDLILFQTLAAKSDFNALRALCRERLLVAPDAATFFRWNKDHSIAKALMGDYAAAYDLLASAQWLAPQFSGVARAKYENEFGLVLVEYNRTALGLERFNVALSHAETPKHIADIEHNIGRAYAAQGEYAKASGYFTRALTFARESNDYRLESEVCASLVEFGGVL